MAATPYVANIVVQYRSGLKESIPATASDVNGEEWVAPDGTDFFRLNGSAGDAKIVDIVHSAAGVDTRTAQIRVNGKLLPEVVLGGANVGTVVNRQFQQTPLIVPAGAQLEFIQVT